MTFCSVVVVVLVVPIGGVLTSTRTELAAPLPRGRSDDRTPGPMGRGCVASLVLWASGRGTEWPAGGRESGRWSQPGRGNGDRCSVAVKEPRHVVPPGEGRAEARWAALQSATYLACLFRHRAVFRRTLAPGR